jgi:hypothetical protein
MRDGLRELRLLRPVGRGRGPGRGR